MTGSHLGDPTPGGRPSTTATVQTPPGLGGITVILLSGPETERILDKTFRPLPSHRDGGEGVLQLGHLIRGERVIDEVIVSRRACRAEINIHGGPAVARAALELLADCGAKVRPPRAGPAETFAPAHPSWDNPAIGTEMLEALPAARSALVVSAMTQQWSGGLSALACSTEPEPQQLRQAAEALGAMRRLLEPAEVVLAGPPNVGKSTLTNALVGRQVSIAHAAPGTTRDWVRELALLEGVPVYLTDTAGIWDAPGEVDAEAVRRARRCVGQADVVVLLDSGELTQCPSWCHPDRTIRVWSKCDIHPPRDAAGLAVSGITGDGLGQLGGAILAVLGLDRFEACEGRAFTARQADLLIEAADAIEAEDGLTAQRALQRLLRGDIQDG